MQISYLYTHTNILTLQSGRSVYVKYLHNLKNSHLHNNSKKKKVQ